MIADWALARQIATTKSETENLAELIFGEDVYDRIDSAVGRESLYEEGET